MNLKLSIAAVEQYSAVTQRKKAHYHNTYRTIPFSIPHIYIQR